MVLDHLRGMVEFWKGVDQPEAEKLDGLVFSMLVMIDGGSGFMPAFKLIPDPHPDDEAYHRSEGENWWAAEDICEDEQLHELWTRKGR